RAGTWRFDANRPNQTQARGERWATGVRNGLALAWNPGVGALYAVSHGRDQLGPSPNFNDQANAELPAEELFRLDRGTDGGWPYCFHDGRRNVKVLAPEYGGDGRQVGRCAGKARPVVAFPAHWAPNDLLWYTGAQFPARYRGGAFVAFHGSWNRAPLPQQGYRVAFVPFRGAQPAGQFETFADGFAGGSPQPGTAPHRPTGLAQGPDGSLYVADDAGGTLWRIVYRGTARR
ncbi:MAG TPA: PQQ-dependent sugar dehydrogenase, partial [Longimicrobium sp.]|nr:PQQ-dependent sugar dehydrogenase [Longimicrobium sp.]